MFFSKKSRRMWHTVEHPVAKCLWVSVFSNKTVEPSMSCLWYSSPYMMLSKWRALCFKWSQLQLRSTKISIRLSCLLIFVYCCILSQDAPPPFFKTNKKKTLGSEAVVSTHPLKLWRDPPRTRTKTRVDDVNNAFPSPPHHLVAHLPSAWMHLPLNLCTFSISKATTMHDQNVFFLCHFLTDRIWVIYHHSIVSRNDNNNNNNSQPFCPVISHPPLAPRSSTVTQNSQFSFMRVVCAWLWKFRERDAPEFTFAFLMKACGVCFKSVFI